jgi:hypothetical protein
VKLFTPFLKETENAISFTLIEDKGNFNSVLLFTIALLFFASEMLLLVGHVFIVQNATNWLRVSVLL